MRILWLVSFLVAAATMAGEKDYNPMILEAIEHMPKGGGYAKYEKTKVGKEFDDLHQTVADLNSAIGDSVGKLKVKPSKAGSMSFCSSATYLLFVDVLARLQAEGRLKLAPAVAKEIAKVGDKDEVIKGNLDGIGIFGHWNADGPGTAVLFQRLDLGTNFSNYAEARPGDFLKIFWNENIGKGESGHLVVFLGTSPDGALIEVWSSNSRNADGTSGYGKMMVEKSRIKRALFSRLEKPENLNKWKDFTEAQKRSEYLIRIRSAGSTEAEMKQVTNARN